MSTKVIRGVILAGFAAATLSAVQTAGATTTPLSGAQTVVDEKAGTYKMHGSLVGDWSITSFVPEVKSPTELVASGKERFVGCIDSNRNTACDPSEPAGSVNFKYLYWAAFNPTAKALVSGQCLHPVLGGTGSFAKATGVIHMKDTPVGKTIRTTYSGMLTYGPTVADRMPTSASVSRGAETPSAC